MGVKNVTGKLGNMRKAVEWVLYPQTADEPHIVIIQSERRIAQVNLTTGLAVLSTGKGGHNGFMHLSPALGATSVNVPPEMLAELKRLISNNVEGNDGEEMVLVGNLLIRKLYK